MVILRCLLGLAFGFAFIWIPETEGQDIPTRVATLEKTVHTHTNQIKALQDKEKALEHKITAVDNDLKRTADLQGAINAVQAADTVDLWFAVNEDIKPKIARLRADLHAEHEGRVAGDERLKGVDQIWKANFRVVNKTFAELRKKAKFLVPAVRVPTG